MNRAKILDISFYQDNPETENIKVDFRKMSLSGTSGVIFRVGQATWEDKKFKTFWDDSSGYGFLRGGYWYYDNSVSPSEQAKKCASIIKGYGVSFELPIFADFEDGRKSLPYHGWDRWFGFMEELKDLLPDFKIGLYTGYYYWMENRPREQYRDRYFSQYPLWIAQYPYQSHLEENKYNEPTFPTTWSDWDLWQVSDRGDGRYHGVESSRVDINYYNGTVEDLYKRYGYPQKIKSLEDSIVESNLNSFLEIYYNGKKVSYSKKQ